MEKRPHLPAWLPTLALLALAAALIGIFGVVASQPDWDARVPEFVALMLLGGVVYLAGVFVVDRFSLGPVALFIILACAVAARAFVLPLGPSLSGDVYRYQWEGRVQRAGINPYTAYPAKPGLERFRSANLPLDGGSRTPTLYPPLSEWSFSWVETVAGYKRLYTAFDVASIGALLLLLALRKQPLHRVLAYAWNPTVIISFAMCGHHDSLAILTLLLAYLLMVAGRPVLSHGLLALSFLSKFFAGVLWPVFLKRTRWTYGAVFLGVVALGYVPFAGAGLELLEGLSLYAETWQSNDSLFRLFLAAGNSRWQAYLIAGVLLMALLAYVLKRRMEPLRAGLVLLGALLLLSPNAFPWYFTWTIPFLCFYSSAPWLLLTVTCVLGYTPVISYSAGQLYADSPFIVFVEYAPVYAWLAYAAWRGTRGWVSGTGVGR